ncbi:uncharacterized protein J5M81_009354 [Pluvialis apricaria]
MITSALAHFELILTWFVASGYIAGHSKLVPEAEIISAWCVLIHTAWHVCLFVQRVGQEGQWLFREEEYVEQSSGPAESTVRVLPRWRKPNWMLVPPSSVAKQRHGPELRNTGLAIPSLELPQKG